jgi:methylmalonyl-CoA/ethylmalonyl-CoA epimerase
VTKTRLRHIALIVEDPEASALFFAAAFGMKRTGEARCGCHMSDGVMTVALLKKESDEERIGVDHFGLWVDDLDAATAQVVTAGAVPVGAHGPPGELAFYEAKFLSPDGIVFDLSHTGWPGASEGPSSSDD